MDKIIIFQSELGGISILIPIPECGISLEEIARKDVPNGVPYLIIDKSYLPKDESLRDAWQADFSIPDGYGIGADAWFAEQERKLK